jgi:hypothetical protein
MMERLRRAFLEFDQRFFYWSKAQSPAEIGKLCRQLKSLIVALTIVGGCIVYFHGRSIRQNEFEALQANERQLVESRRRRKTQQHATVPRKTFQVAEHPRSSSFQ